MMMALGLGEISANTSQANPLSTFALLSPPPMETGADRLSNAMGALKWLAIGGGAVFLYIALSDKGGI